MAADGSVAKSEHFTMYTRQLTVTPTQSNARNLCPSRTDISTLHKQFLHSRRKIHHSRDGTILQFDQLLLVFVYVVCPKLDKKFTIRTTGTTNSSYLRNKPCATRSPNYLCRSPCSQIMTPLHRTLPSET